MAESTTDTTNTNVTSESVVDVLRTVFDPEIPVNIYDLGLVYEVDVDPAGKVQIQMTLTSPACPVAGSLPPEVESKIKTIEGVTDAVVEVVWDPPWTPERISAEGKQLLGIG